MASDLFSQIGPRTVPTQTAQRASPAATQGVQGAAAARQASAAESGSLPPLVGSEPNPANSAIAQDPAAIESSVRQINDYVQTLNRDIEFSVDKEHNRTIIKVIDSDTGEVIRQLPPEDVLQLAKRLEQMDGLLVREKA